MTKGNNNLGGKISRRQLAEDQLKKKQDLKSVLPSDTDLTKLVHELQVHQIELEMQNEELRQARDAAEASSEKFILLYDFAPMAYFNLDSEGTICELNLRAATLLESERSKLIDQNLKHYIVPNQIDTFQDSLRKIFESKSNVSCELELTTKKKKSIIIQCEGNYLENEKKCLLTGVDITATKLASKELEKLNQQVTDLSASKDEIYSIIGHDLRSPFHTIVGFTKLILKNIRGNDIEKKERFARDILATANQTLELLDDLLAWTTLQTGQISFVPEDLDLNTIIDDIIENANLRAENKGIALSYSRPDKIIICADKQMLKAMLRNVLSNAIKFTPRGGDINISSLSDQNHIEIKIRDNGLGMDKETQMNLFNDHTAIQKKGTENESGTGIGLKLCKKFVAMHGGEIWVKSEIGKGSEFHFTLPKN